MRKVVVALVAAVALSLPLSGSATAGSAQYQCTTSGNIRTCTIVYERFTCTIQFQVHPYRFISGECHSTR